MSRHRFLVATSQLGAETVTLLGEELRHLRARHITLGEQVILSDGAGGERDAVVATIHRDRADLRYVSPLRQRPVSGLRITLAQALLKGDKLDWVIEKATELGVDRVRLFESERVIAGISVAKLERLRRLATSAAKQCQRAQVPDISSVVPWPVLLEADGDAQRFVFWEEAVAPLRQVVATIPTPQDVVVIIGPEGGLTQNEVEAAQAAGCHIVSLGEHILRAETAALAAVTLCRYAWSIEQQEE